MSETIISLGSNLGDKGKNIKIALEALNLIPETKVIAISKMYETKPLGVPNKQDNYMNCCAKISTNLRPQIFMGCLLGIEAAMGRKRIHRFCERIIDLDMIFYEDMQIDEKNLVVPHPRAMSRAFVLVPLSDICPDMKFKGIDFSKEYRECDKSILIKIK